MTTVIIPGAPVARPGPVREVLPRPPSLTYSGSRTRAYREWYYKYGSLDNYKAYKRTRQWRAGGARHGGGQGDDYEREYNKDPLTHAWNDVTRYLGARPWNSSQARRGDTKESDWRGEGWIYDGNKWVKHYDKPAWTDDSYRHANMLTKGDYQNRLSYQWDRNAKMYHQRHRNDKPIGYYKPKPRTAYIHRGNIRTMRYRRFRPGFFKRDDHY